MWPRRHFNQTFPAFGGPAMMILTQSHSSSAHIPPQTRNAGPDDVGFRAMIPAQEAGAGERSRGLSLGRLWSVTKTLVQAGARSSTRLFMGLSQDSHQGLACASCSFIANIADF